MRNRSEQQMAAIITRSTKGHQLETAKKWGIPVEELSTEPSTVVHVKSGRKLSYGEIAARLECSEGAARRRVHRGLARLNNLMQVEATS